MKIKQPDSKRYLDKHSRSQNILVRIRAFDIVIGKVKPRVKYHQYKDTGWNVCRDMVKNLNKLQLSQTSFLCKLRFHPDMPQFSEPEWEVLKIEDNWQMIYELSNYWVKTSDRPPFAKWQAQYLRNMQNGYTEGKILPSGFLLHLGSDNKQHLNLYQIGRAHV